MDLFNVQITTDYGPTIVLQISASSEAEAEMTAISMVDNGNVGTQGINVIDCFTV